MRKLKRLIEKYKWQVVFLDPMYLAMGSIGSDASNQFSVGELLFPLGRVGQQTNCTIVIVHHTKKRQRDHGFGPPELEDIAWSGFAEWVRQWILIGRRVKYEPGSGSHELWMNCGGSAGHNSLWGVNIEEGSREDDGGRRWEPEVIEASKAIRKIENQISAITLY